MLTILFIFPLYLSRGWVYFILVKPKHFTAETAQYVLVVLCVKLGICGNIGSCVTVCV